MEERKKYLFELKYHLLEKWIDLLSELELIDSSIDNSYYSYSYDSYDYLLIK